MHMFNYFVLINIITLSLNHNHSIMKINYLTLIKYKLIKFIKKGDLGLFISGVKNMLIFFNIYYSRWELFFNLNFFNFF
jgi:hypothetical protein